MISPWYGFSNPSLDTEAPCHTEARTAERPWEIQFLYAPASGQSKRNICLGQAMGEPSVVAGAWLRPWLALIPSAGGVDNEPTIDT